MKWGLTIEKLGNGYLIQPYQGCEGNSIVIEIKEDTVKGEQEAFREVIYGLRDFFAVHNDKHINQFLEVKVSEGDL